ncbi:MAG: hypothetical protein HQL88_06005 [Magnetococcales bacterium]|nr:hypothetical protein [Magnetococcales bacterium]
MKKEVAACVLGLLSLCSTPLLAEDAAPEADKNKLAGFTLSGNLTLANEYVSRGLTASDHGVALQGTLNANHDSGFYLGFFGSNVDFNDGDGSSLEIDLTAGYTREWSNGLSLDLGVIAYLYPKSPDWADYDYREYFLGGGYKLDSASLKVKYFYSDDYTGPVDESASYLDTQLAYELPVKVTLKGHYGYAFGDWYKVQNTRGIRGFSDYSLGAATELAGFGFEVNYVGVDNDGRFLNPSAHADGRGIFSVSKSF